MGKKDRAEKVFVGCRDVFAELINGLLYGGKAVLEENELLPGPTESFYAGRQDEIRNQFRDLSMYQMQHGKVHALYNLENQSITDERMPLRCAGYDGAAYRSQYRKKRGQEIYPVVSIVLNWGEKVWDGARSVRELVDNSSVEVPEKMKPYLDRNRIAVYDMRFLPEEVRKRFEGDVRVVLDYLSDRENLIRRNQKLKNPEEVMRMLYALSEDERYLENIEFMEEREGTGMCDLLDEAENRGRKQGIEQGKTLGLEQGKILGLEQGVRALIATCKEFGASFEETAGKLKKRFGLEEAEIERDMKLYW